jgi:hypothetical protein
MVARHSLEDESISLEVHLGPRVRTPDSAELQVIACFTTV